jgi:hypothetical protein
MTTLYYLYVFIMLWFLTLKIAKSFGIYLADFFQHDNYKNKINIFFINQISFYVCISQMVYFLTMCLNFGNSNQIQLNSYQQNKVTTWNYG